MIFTETKLKGAYIIEVEPKADSRGFFTRAWCQDEFIAQGLNPTVVQVNLGFSHRQGTLRGMHYQTAPWAEVKVVRCTLGAIYDVIIDLRSDSSTHRQWIGLELSQDNHKMLYVPEGFAHGYVTLTDNAEMCYQTSQFFSREYANGVRYNDPAFDIRWPLEIQVISEQDKNWLDYTF
ncbi:MAG TPA: dTDP-4-dehydrorhamnose 3,5-epimerase [Anaerolineae bacterium]|nr:dTDP-4-dehydrorhamnose 3,5-epimerase [Anaerolineae bacterium]